MLRPVRRPPSVHTLAPAAAAARPRFRCPDCGAASPSRRARGEGAPPKPRCLACGFLATVEGTGMGEALGRVLRRAEVVERAALQGAPTPPPPAPATVAGGQTASAGDPCRRPIVFAARDPLATAHDPLGKARARLRHGSGIISRAAEHVGAARAHVGAARRHVGAAAAQVERARASVARFRNGASGTPTPG